MDALLPSTTDRGATMSSREIAELCEKRHDHVLRDIEKMLEDIGGPKSGDSTDPKLGVSDFLSNYIDSTGRSLKEYRLPKDLTITLITGYRADLRYKVVKRLEELEAAARSNKVIDLKDPVVLLELLTEHASKRIEAEQRAAAAEGAAEEMGEEVQAHHRLTSQGLRTLGLAGEAEPLKPMTEAGSGGVQDKDKALLAKILSRVNDLFQGDLTDDDRLIYVNGVIRGKLLENETLVQQSEHNSKEQFAASPSLRNAMVDAIIDAFDAHAAMSKQALDSSEVREGLIDVLLGPSQLCEALRKKGWSGEQAGR